MNRVREHARLYAKLPIYRKRLAAAQKIIHDSLEQVKSPYVACSFGKDSAVVLHMVQQVMPSIQARFIRWPETDLLANYQEIMDQWRARGANIAVLDLYRDSLDDKVSDRWLQLQSITPSDGYFSGMRKDESRVRKMILNTQGPIAFIKQSQSYRICPIANWSTNDVAAYVVANDLPMLNTYVNHGFEARTASRVPRAAYSIREDALKQLQMDDPAAFRQLQKMYPEVSQWL